jgi:hypothetical protein
VVRETGIAPEVVRQAARARRRTQQLAFPRWVVDRTIDEAGRRIVVRDPRNGDVRFDVTYPNRIELATSAVSGTGRFTVFVQSNNVASEVTVLDAESGARRTIRLPHDAPLAAYAIGITFAPGKRCAAISMERIGGPRAETWLVDLRTGAVEQWAIPGLFVLDWARAR